ncbi:helix-turn-helix domain-containing protein [Pseudoalteromonas xiamenensis]
MSVIDISKLSKQSGIPASTLRYYEEKGLIRSVGRAGLKRTYTPMVFERLNFISLGQQAGFSLDEIQSMILKNGEYEVDRAMLLQKADDIASHIKHLTAIQRCLEHAANCNAPSHAECPKFQQLLKLANKGRRSLKRNV